MIPRKHGPLRRRVRSACFLPPSSGGRGPWLNAAEQLGVTSKDFAGMSCLTLTFLATQHEKPIGRILLRALQTPPCAKAHFGARPHENPMQRTEEEERCLQLIAFCKGARTRRDMSPCRRRLSRCPTGCLFQQGTEPSGNFPHVL
jgi:hypothetical protein